MDNGTLLEGIKALYVFPTSGNTRHTNLLHTLRGMNLNLTSFDPNFWIKGREGGYNYIGAPNDDLLVISKDPPYIFEKMKEIYMIKVFGAPKVHLGCGYT